MIKRFQRILNKIVEKLYTPPIIFQDSELSKIILDSDYSEKEETRSEDRDLEANKTKRAIFEKSLETGIATIYVDSRISGVQVPDNLKGVPDLVLNYSYKYNIPDFKIDEEKIVASLSFSRSLYQCVIPWNAVFAIINQSESSVYDFSGTLLSREQKVSDDVKSNPKKGLTLIEGSSEDHSDVQESRPRPKLTLIKGGKS